MKKNVKEFGKRVVKRTVTDLGVTLCSAALTYVITKVAMKAVEIYQDKKESKREYDNDVEFDTIPGQYHKCGCRDINKESSCDCCYED